MKDILKQFAYVFLALGGCIVQLVALIFAGIGWVFSKLGSLLADISCMTVKKQEAETEDISEEEVPA